MVSFESFRRNFQSEYDATWQRIFDRHRDLIAIKRTKVALPNLQKVISAALQISNRSSFHSMSLRELSRQADVSMGALYSYISSKEQLAVMILEHVLFLVDTVLECPSEPSLSPEERLRWLLRTHIYLSEVMQPWFFFAYMEAKTFNRQGRRLAIESELRTEQLVVQCLTDAQTAGAFAAADPTVTASLIKPLLQDWYLKSWKYRRRQVDPSTYADWVISFVEAASSGPPQPHMARQ